MKSTLKKWFSYLRWDWDMYELECKMSGLHPSIIRYVGYMLRDVSLSAECWAKGCDLESDDWGTPESGYMGVHCNRCGWSCGSYLY